MNGNHDQRNQNMRRPAASQNGQRPEVRRPQSRRPQGVPPLRPQQRRGQAGVNQRRPQSTPSPEEKKLSRNVILALILLGLVLLLGVIFGVQSCSKAEPSDEYHGNDNVILNTTEPPSIGGSRASYAKYTDANKNVVLNSTKAEAQRLQQEMNLAYQVYSQVATQLEGARIKVQQDKPVFAVLEPVTVPYKKSAPSKAKILIVFTLLSACLAAAWILFLEDFWKKFKNNL